MGMLGGLQLADIPHFIDVWVVQIAKSIPGQASTCCGSTRAVDQSPARERQNGAESGLANGARSRASGLDGTNGMLTSQPLAQQDSDADVSVEGSAALAMASSRKNSNSSPYDDDDSPMKALSTTALLSAVKVQ